MTFHFVISLSVPRGAVSFASTYVPAAGETREDAYRKIVAYAKKEAGEPNSAVVFFSFEPNELPEVAR